MTNFSLTVKAWYLHMWRFNDIVCAIKFSKCNCCTILNLFLDDRKIFQDCSDIFGKFREKIRNVRLSFRQCSVLTREISSWTLEGKIRNDSNFNYVYSGEPICNNSPTSTSFSKFPSENLGEREKLCAKYLPKTYVWQLFRVFRNLFENGFAADQPKRGIWTIL